MSAVLHFWEMCDPRPVFLCGNKPKPGTRNAVPVMRVTPASAAWFARQPMACRTCICVVEARLRARPAARGAP